MKVESHDENGEDAEEQYGVYEHGLAVGGEASEFDRPDVARELENEPRREQNEEQQAYQDGSPIHYYPSSTTNRRGVWGGTGESEPRSMGS